MKLFKLFFFVALVTFVACKNETGSFKTSNGYEYIIHSKGSGPKAKIGDYLFYTIKTQTDAGKVLQEVTDSEASQPIEVFGKDSEEAKGNFWNEVFLLVNEGDSISLVMPTDSLPQKSPELEGAKSLNFVIKIAKVMDKAAYDKFVEGKKSEMEAKAAEMSKKLPEIEALIKKTLADNKANKLATVKLPSGLSYFIHEAGTGAKGEEGKMAKVQYYGMMENGEMFDNSFSRGSSFEFPIGQGQVIKGWDEALMNLKAGDKATLFIPSDLAYGATGNSGIPPNSNLVFYIEVEDIK